MDAPCDTNMEVIPKTGMLSLTTMTMVPITDAADIFEVQRDSKGQMTGWHISITGGAAVYHHRGYTMCGIYAAHLMEAYEEGTVRLPNRVIGQAIEMAWPDILCNIDNVVDE